MYWTEENSFKEDQRRLGLKRSSKKRGKKRGGRTVSQEEVDRMRKWRGKARKR